MKILNTLILLPIMILLLSCSNDNTNSNSVTEEEIRLDDNHDVLIIYTRREQSKDSNGTEIKIGLTKKKLNYYEKHWGFKASNKVTKKTIKIDDEFLDYIYNFIENKLPDENFNKEIKIKEKRAFTTFRYELYINKTVKKYKIDISSDDIRTEDPDFNNLEHLFSELKSKFKLKRKY